MDPGIRPYYRDKKGFFFVSCAASAPLYHEGYPRTHSEQLACRHYRGAAYACVETIIEGDSPLFQGPEQVLALAILG
jgi:hypothetical protein